MDTIAHRLAGRSDLLRVLAAAADDAQADRLAAVLGFERSDEPAADEPPPRRRRTLSVPREAEAAPATLRAPLLGAVAVHESAGPDLASPEPTVATSPLAADDWGPEPGAPLLRVPPIVRRSAALPALDRALRYARPGGANVQRLLEHLARLELPARLPRRTVQRQANRWMLVLDARGPLRPYAPDMALLARWGDRACGGAALTVAELISSEDPLEGWIEVPMPRPGRLATPPPEGPRNWDALASVQRVVLVSELALTTSADGSLRQAWVAWFDRVRSAGATVEVWSPVPLRATAPPAAVQGVRVLHWSGASALRPVPLHQGKPHATDERMRAADALVARMALAPRIDETLVRAMRLAAGEPDAGLEHLAWTSPALTRGLATRMPRQEHLDALRQDFEALPREQRAQSRDILERHYRALSQPLVHLHALAHGPDAAGYDEALRFFERLTTHPTACGVSRLEARLFLHQWVARVDGQSRQRLGGLLVRAVSALKPLADDTGDALELPPDLPHASLAARWAATTPARRWHLVQDTASGTIALLEGEPAAPTQVDLLGRPLVTASADLQRGGEPRRTWIELETRRRHELMAVSPRQATAVLRTSGLRVEVGPVNRPRGVAAWHRSRQGLHVQGVPLGTRQLVAGPDRIELHPRSAASDDTGLRLTVPPQGMPGTGTTFGIDDHGLWADVSIRAVVQRFRWIEPGEFRMGSPPQEAGRLEDEGPQHLVWLSAGFWLADSACTQALWQAVMGDNPSHFKGDGALPVEQVSWDDVQRFLARVQAELPPGVQAVLPTEAQWEYACRASTTTPFSFGEQIDPTQVNYDGDHPYAGGRKGEYRQRTVPVKSLPPNAWGLHEMHGNVFEWCADGLRKYTRRSATDPRGPEGGRRAVRGGSWLYSGWGCRSAYRIALEPGDAVGSLGFRLALRSMVQPGEDRAAERPAGAVAGGARPGPAEPGPARRRRA